MNTMVGLAESPQLIRIEFDPTDERLPRLSMNIAYVRPFLLAATVALYFAATAVAAEPEVDQPLPPTEAARTMIVPDGFQVTLFAGEPDVRQ
ncbi:MAG: hypothetical protein KDA71_10745, partial [Planctomycetales bacterium]|nr:hypothetical protein [Planctomycetales bacterium]